MNRFAVVLAAAAALARPGTGQAAQCRNAQGHFIKCAPTPAAKAPAMAAVRAPAKRATPAHKTASSGARCRNAKGQFAKCGTPGAKAG